MKKSGKSFKGRSRKSEQVDRDESPCQLPQLQDQLCVGMTLRFITTSAFTGAFGVTVGNLLDAWFIAGTATTAYQLFDYVKVKSVTIRGLGVSDISGGKVYTPSCTVATEFYGLSSGTFSGGKQKTNTSLGYDTPAYVRLKPDPRSQAAQFQANSTNALFVVRAVDSIGTPIVGAVIDVAVVYRNSADVAPASLGTARAGLNPGYIYFGGLDGATDAATQARSAFVPRA
jgi:hypothetical protein